MHVVVVESPSKAKTINKYLGGEYTVLASYGHFVRHGIEPMAVSSDDRKIPAGPRTTAGTTSRPRRHTMIWFGGFGGK